MVWDWADNPTGESILWIHGPAGLGKSTLAHHLKQDLQSNTRLAASVFLGDLPTDSWGPESAIRLIAGELGRIHSSAVPAIAEAARKCHGAPIPTQMEKFILDPLRALQLQHPLIVLMDGVDEWKNSASFVGELGLFAPHISLVRFLLLGRAEPGKHDSPSKSIRAYRLKRVPGTVMTNYINKRFDAIEWEHGRRPTALHVESIVARSEGMFIWSAIVCGLLENNLSAATPLEIVAAVVYRETVQGSDALWKLYYDAIGLLFPTQEDKDMLRVFLGGNILVEKPLKTADFAYLVGMRIPAIKDIQSRLKALQLCHPDDEDSMVYPAEWLYHTSFTQYLKGASTPAAIAFSIPLRPTHSQLALGCLHQILGFLPTPRKLESLYLTPLRCYAVERIHWHLTMGSPSMAPGADTEWKNTPHYSILESAPIELYLQWADLFLSLLKKKKKVPATPSTMKTFSKEPYSKGDVGRLLLDVANIVGPNLQWPLSPVYLMSMAVLIQPDNAESWRYLATFWSYLDEYTDDADFMDRAVEASQNAVKAGEISQSTDQVELQVSLAISLIGRFDRTYEPEDIDRAIALTESALLSLPIGHPQRPGALSTLVASLGYRYDGISRSPDDLDRAISLSIKTDLSFTPDRGRAPCDPCQPGQPPLPSLRRDWESRVSRRVNNDGRRSADKLSSSPWSPFAGPV